MLIIDFSSIMGAFMHLTDEEYGLDVKFKGKTYHIPDPETSLERFEVSYKNMIDGLGIRSSNVVVVCDPKKSRVTTIREKIFPEYKLRKDEMPPKFFRVRKELFELGVQWLKDQGAIIATPSKEFEADDLINELVTRIDGCVIWTRDKDLLACPADVMLQGSGEILFNPEKFPVPNDLIHCYRTVVTGDPSDNLPSCKGFGVKAWEKFVEFYGEEGIRELDRMLREECLDELEENVEEFSKLRLLIDQKEILYRTYRCVSFYSVPAYKVKWEGGMNKGIVQTLVTRENFDEVFRRISNLKFDTYTIDYETDVCEESRKWSKDAEITVDVMGSEIVGMGLLIGEEAWYFCVDHRDTDNITVEDLKKILLLCKGKKCLAHNATGFEQPVTYNHFGFLIPEMIDTALMASYVDENNQQRLKYLSKRWLGYTQATYQETLGDASGMRELSGKEVFGYGVDDVICTDALFNLFKVILKYEKSWDVFKTLECESAYFTTLCFINGIYFDEGEFKKLKEENDRKTKELWDKLNVRLLSLGWEGARLKPFKGKSVAVYNELFELVHGYNPGYSSVKEAIRENPDDIVTKAMINNTHLQLQEDVWEPKARFNIRSPKQMSKLLYNVLKIPVRVRNKPTENMKKQGKQGSPATNEVAIQNAIAFGDVDKEGRELLELLLEYKACLTKESLFFSKWPYYVHWKTGKIHPQLRQSATTTRRWSCSSPNVMQMSKSKGIEIRNMVKAPDGYVIASFDFSGQELRVAADDSRDPDFVACYIGDDKKDVHSLTGLKIAVKRGESLDYESFMQYVEEGDKKVKGYRTLGKKINFTCQYGAMAKKVGQTLCIREKEAEEYIKAREEAFPVLIQRVKDWHKECRKKKYAYTMLGVRRHLHGFKHYGSRDEFLKSAADRLAYSMRIQGSSAEITKQVCGRLYREGYFESGEIIPMFPVHDEIDLYIKEEIVDKVIPKIVEIMEQPYADMIIPMETEPEIGPRWGELKKSTTVS